MFDPRNPWRITIWDIRFTCSSSCETSKSKSTHNFLVKVLCVLCRSSIDKLHAALTPLPPSGSPKMLSPFSLGSLVIADCQESTWPFPRSPKWIGGESSNGFRVEDGCIYSGSFFPKPYNLFRYRGADWLVGVGWAAWLISSWRMVMCLVAILRKNKTQNELFNQHSLTCTVLSRIWVIAGGYLEPLKICQCQQPICHTP